MSPLFSDKRTMSPEAEAMREEVDRLRRETTDSRQRVRDETNAALRFFGENMNEVLVKLQQRIEALESAARIIADSSPMPSALRAKAVSTLAPERPAPSPGERELSALRGDNAALREQCGALAKDKAELQQQVATLRDDLSRARQEALDLGRLMGEALATTEAALRTMEEENKKLRDAMAFVVASREAAIAERDALRGEVAGVR